MRLALATQLTSFLAVALLGAAPAAAQVTTKLPRELEGIDVQNRLGGKVDLDLAFTDHTGRAVRLGEYFDGERPVLLTLNYYRCRTLCSVQLNKVVEALQAIDWVPGREAFRLVTVSIDPREGHDLAADKRASYLASLGAPQADWPFLVGSAEASEALAAQVGFEYSYDEGTDQYAHAPVIFVLTPDGTISRYLFTLQPPPQDIKFALMDASNGAVGSTFDKVLSSCFQYMSSDGKYTPFAWGVMRLGGLFTVFVLALFLVHHWRRDRRRPQAYAEPTP